MKKRVDELLARIPVIPINFISTALTSLLLIGLSFALYLPSLGFYLDDWPQLYSLVVHGTEGIKTYFLYDDRPFGWWPDLLVFKVWGTNPIGWHLTNYLLRWLVGLGIWGVFTKIWQNHKREIFWSVQLFAVFPLFLQQSMGLTFIAHWFCYGLFFLSILLMLLAVKKPKIRLLLIVLSLAASAFNLFTYENFIGIEFLRPVFLWLALRNLPRDRRIKQTLFYWLPFIGLAGFYIVWRLILMPNIRGLDPTLLINFSTQPFRTIITLINFAIRDVIYLLFAVWFPTINPSTIDISVPYVVISYMLSVVVGIVLALLFLNNKKIEQLKTGISSYSIYVEGIIVGVGGILLGCAPGWLIGASVTNDGLWVDRFALPAIWAASITTVCIIAFFFRKTSKRYDLLIIILIAIAVGWNFRVTNEYKWSSIWQNRFVSQLKWRAPGIKPNTSFLANNELFPKVGVYPTSFMLNIIYPEKRTLSDVNYWFFTLSKYFPNNLSKLKEGIEIHQGHWYSKFSANSRDSLVISWTMENQHCLWILTENDRYNPAIDETTRLALGASNPGRIIPENEEGVLDPNLFGVEDRNNWCFYYETGDLARQKGDWQQAINLYEEAIRLGFKPNHGTEYIPFIEAYAHLGKADMAANLTELAEKKNENMENYICDTWNRLAKEITGDLLFNEQYKLISEKDSCQVIK